MRAYRGYFAAQMKLLSDWRCARTVNFQGGNLNLCVCVRVFVLEIFLLGLQCGQCIQARTLADRQIVDKWPDKW